MHRRAFLRLLGVGAAGAAVAPYLPLPSAARAVTGSKALYARLTFNGIPLVFDPNCPPNRVYFLNATHLELQRVVWDMAHRGF
jgi:hypothetical protein